MSLAVSRAAFLISFVSVDNWKLCFLFMPCQCGAIIREVRKLSAKVGYDSVTCMHKANKTAETTTGKRYNVVLPQNYKTVWLRIVDETCSFIYLSAL